MRIGPGDTYKVVFFAFFDLHLSFQSLSTQISSVHSVMVSSVVTPKSVGVSSLQTSLRSEILGSNIRKSLRL